MKINKTAIDRYQKLRLPLILFSTTLAYLTGVTLSAQEDSKTEDEIFELSPFEVSIDPNQGYNPEKSIAGTKVVADLKDVPLSISVVTSALIEDLAATSLEDTLRFTTSVNFQQPAAALNTPSIFIRGNETRYVLRDGFVRWRGNEAFFIEQVEIIKGPTAILYGQALPGGAINYSTKRPYFDDNRSGQASVGYDTFNRYFVNVDANVQANDNLAVRALGVIRQGETFADYEKVDYRAWQVGLVYHPTSTTKLFVNYDDISNHVDNPQTAGTIYWRGPLNKGSEFLNQQGELGGGIGYHPLAEPGTNPWGHPDLGTYADQETDSITMRLEQKLWDGLYARLTYHEIDTRNSGRTGDTNDTSPLTGDSAVYSDNFISNVFGNPRSGTPGQTIDVNGNSYVVGDNKVLADNTIPDATPGAYHEGQRMVAVYTRPGGGQLRFIGNDLSVPGLYNPNVVPPRGLAEGFNQNSDDIIQAEITYEFEVANTSHRILAGFDDRRGKFYNPSGTPLNPGGNEWKVNVHGVAYNLETRELQDVNGNPYTRGNEFLRTIDLDKGTPTKDEEQGMFVTYTGDFFDERLHILLGYRDTEASSTDTSGTTAEFTNESPQYGALYQITESVGIFASRSESFLLTNARFTSIPPHPDNPDAYTPNAAFPPQEGTGTDIGFKFDFANPRITGALTYFEIMHDQIPIQDPDVLNENGNPVAFPGGENYTEGVELELFFAPTDNWQIKGGITWLDARYQNVDPAFEILEGKRLTQSAEWQASIWARYEFSDGFLEGLALGGGANYLGDRIRHLHTPVEEWPNKARTVVDVFARYRTEIMQHDVEFGLNIQNLFDEFYDSQITRAFPGINATVEMTVYF